MSDHKQNLKRIKAILASKYGYKNVSVRNGSGTAWGWVTIEVIAEVVEGVHEQIEKMIKKAGIELYTYTDDMGYENECLLIYVRKNKNEY